MPFRRLLFCCFVFSSLALAAQQKQIDSLLLLLQTHLAEDTNRLNILNDLVYRYAETDIEKGLEMADSAIQLGHRIKAVRKLGLAYRNKGELLYYNTDYEGALQEARKALAYFEKVNDAGQIGSCYFLMGYAFYSLGQYPESIGILEKAALYQKKTGSQTREAAAYSLIGSGYTLLANYPRAVEYHYKTLDIYKATNDSGRIAIAISSLGFVNKQMGNFDKALEFYKQAVDVYRRLGNKEYEADIQMKIGTVYDSKGETEKALFYYRLAYNVNKEGNFIKGLGETMGNIGIAYAGLKQYDSAMHYLHEATALLVNKIKDRRNESVIYNTLGNVVLNAPVTVLQKHGIAPAARYRQAEDFLQKSLDVAEEHQLLSQQYESLESLSKLYAATGRYKEAFEASRKGISLKDSILSGEKRDEITKREMQFEFDKKQAVLNATHAAEIRQEKTIRYFVLGGAGLIIFAAVLLFWSYKRRRDAKARQQEAELQAEIADTEMKVMRLQMNPHFIFNSLNSISDYIRKNDPAAADEYLSRFARVMRMTLENSELQAIPLEDDLKALELYMQLEAKRLNNRFTYTIQVAADIDRENTLVPPLIFQPFVENSIWHGIAKKEGTGHIDLTIRKEGDMLHCVIDDDGIGREKAAQAKEATAMSRQSLGMKITRARINMLNKLRGSRADVRLMDKEQGLKAELLLPLYENF